MSPKNFIHDIYHNNILKKEINHFIIQNDKEKYLDKAQHSFLILKRKKLLLANLE